MSCIGGASVIRAINDNLKFIISHKFALTLRFTDASGKFVFGGTKCCKLVKGTFIAFTMVLTINFYCI